MDSFEFAFSLFGLLLGLSIAEIVGGIARVMRSRREVRLGIVAPLIGLLLFVDLVSFWSNSWEVRALIPVDLATLLFGATVAAIYYFAASLAFPTDLSEWPDLDDYAMRHKAVIMAVIVIANLAADAGRNALMGVTAANWRMIAIPFVFTGFAAVIALAKTRRLTATMTCGMLSLYAIFRFI